MDVGTQTWHIFKRRKALLFLRCPMVFSVFVFIKNANDGFDPSIFWEKGEESNT